MKISKNWVKEYLNLDNYTDEELFDLINAHICEIDSYKPIVKAENLTIGFVKDCVVHPNSDHLHVCMVEVRPNEIVQIVCGAPNIASGLKVIVANVGAVLPGDFKIKAAKLRGVESNGMICSLEELGIEDKYIDEEFKNGIYILDEKAPIGEDPLAYLGFDDVVIDLALTSNRADLMSIEGFAYDLGAVLNRKVTPIEPKVKESLKPNPLKIKIETADCYKYFTRVIENVKITSSPQWLKARLIACGIRPINNVVDVTNYVLLELGQPLHAFDKDRLGSQIIIRNANSGEELVTLDGIKRKLSPSDIVIANQDEAMCLAGIMGGLNSEIDEDTVSVVLEAAYFDPVTIRKTSARLGLKSESSMRFERKVDFERVERALDYAAKLICQIAGGEVCQGRNGEVKRSIKKKNVEITVTKINKVLGTSLSQSQVEDIFRRLSYNYRLKGEIYTLELPSWRMDLEASYQDVIEDVARINGYDNIPTTIADLSSGGGLTFAQRRLRFTRQLFSSMGFNEAISYSLVAKKDLNLFTNGFGLPVEVMMPLTEDRCVMRQSLINGLVDTIAYNKARKAENLAFFEIGNTYSLEAEKLKLAGAVTGLFTSNLWKGDRQVADFYVLKGLLENYFAKLNVHINYVTLKNMNGFHPGRTAGLLFDNNLVGVLGEIHPRLAKELGVLGTVVFEIELTDILTNESYFKYHSINKYPSVTRDLAIVVKKDVLVQDVMSLISKTVADKLSNMELFDLYTGENIAKDEKSIAVKLTLEDHNKTLETNEIDEIISEVIKRLEYTFGAHLRD